MNKDTICKFGQGKQNMASCKMIYIHIIGYYPTKEDYEFALKNLCPNFKKRWDSEGEGCLK
jgi:hypothetical protein